MATTEKPPMVSSDSEPDSLQKAAPNGTDSDLEKGSAAAPEAADGGEGNEEPSAEDTRPGARAGLTVTQFWITIFGLNLGMLLTALDFNIVATAVPIISSEFNDYKNSSWLGTGFLISFALVLPVYAKLGDIFGRVRMFIVGTVIFILGSGLCGGANSMNMLIASRLVQGLGAGGIYGLVNVIVTDLVPLRDVGKYLSFTAAIWAIADVAGPLMGGAFSQYVSWRWCFWINLCISPISLVITLVFLRNLNPPKTNLGQALKTYDYIGTLTLVGGTTCVLLAVSWGGVTFAWSSAKIIALFIVFLVLITLFVVSQFYVPDPLIVPEFLKSRTLLAIFFAEFFYGAVLLGMMYYVPQFFQLVFGDSATLSGVGLLPMMLGLGAGNPLAGWITSKYGISLWNAIAGGVLQVLIVGLMTRWNGDTSRAEAVVELIIAGFGQGAIMSGLLLSAQVAVKQEQVGIVTGLTIFTQIVGTMFGIACFAAVYVNNLTSTFSQLGLPADLVEKILSNVQEIHSITDAAQKNSVVQTYAKSMQNGWWLLFAAACASLICMSLSRQKKFT